MTLKPTAEQAEAIRLALLGDDLRIDAAAGSGKSSTLKMIAEEMTDRTGIYTAFNSAIVKEIAAELPSNFDGRTLHSLAFRTEGARLKHKLNGPRMKGQEIARKMGVKELTVTTKNGRRTFAAGWCASQAVASIRRFTNSDRSAPGAFDVPIPRAAQFDEEMAEMMDEIRDHIAQYLPAFWDDLTSVDGVLPMDHNVYLASAVINGLVANSDVLMIDECQDLTRRTIQFCMQSRAAGSQIIAVGDQNQAIYGWMGATNLAPYLPDANVTQLTNSFRFGPPIADVANSILTKLGTDMRIIGAGGPSEVRAEAEPDCILSRTNATAVRGAFAAMEQGRSFHIIGGADDVVRFCEAARELMAGKTVFHPDLVCFSSWPEVERYVKEDPLGGDLALLVRLIADFGIDKIISVLRDQERQDRADVVLATGHKTKGLAWPKVRLAQDFSRHPDSYEDGEASPEELRLLYVACTRAKTVLDVSLLEQFSTRSGVASATAEVVEAPVPELAPAPKALPQADLDEMAGPDLDEMAKRTDREGFYARIARDKAKAAAAAAEDQ